STATDLVLTITQMLRAKGVVGKFVEFYGPGVSTLPLADRATIGNMAPEYGATIGIFPVDQETLRYLEFTGRPAEHVHLVEAYMKEQGLFHTPDAPEPLYTDTLELNLATVEPSMAGPRRPQDRVGLREVPRKFAEALPTLMKPVTVPAAIPVPVGRWEGEGGQAGPKPPPPPPRSANASWWSARCCRATAISRAGSSKRSARTISPRPRWSWRTRSPAASTSTSTTSRSGSGPTDPCSCATSGRPPRKSP